MMKSTLIVQENAGKVYHKSMNLSGHTDKNRVLHREYPEKAVDFFRCHYIIGIDNFIALSRVAEGTAR